VIDQDQAHLLRRDREKVRPILPADRPGTEQPEIDLVDKGGRL
jgi:hypothetical protein